jgi:hypothetical protein
MISAIVLIVVGVVYRTLLATATSGEPGWISNFSPLAAIALCGAIYLPKKMAVALPLFTLLISDLIVDVRAGLPLFHDSLPFRYGALSLIILAGVLLRSDRKLWKLLVASIGSSFLFYFLSNAGAWISAPEYAHNLAGFWQSETTGLPGYAPAWMFFRNSMISDLLFTCVFIACMSFNFARKPATERRLTTV